MKVCSQKILLPNHKKLSTLHTKTILYTINFPVVGHRTGSNRPTRATLNERKQQHLCIYQDTSYREGDNENITWLNIAILTELSDKGNLIIMGTLMIKQKKLYIRYVYIIQYIRLYDSQIFYEIRPSIFACFYIW